MKKAISGNVVTFTFDGLEPLTFDATKATAEMRAYAEMNGWNHRLGDMAALSRTGKDGAVRTITEAMRRDAIAEGIAHYEGGATSWDMGAGARGPVRSPMIQKIADKRGISYEEAQAMIAEQFLNDVE